VNSEVKVLSSKRTKKGRGQAALQSPDHAFRRKPLYRELEKIGRNEKCIKPTALKGYRHLLASQEIEQRADSADIDKRAQCAKQAILDGIGELVDDNHRLVAEAVLATNEPFEGKSVQFRQQYLEATAHIMPQPYKEYRRRILKWLVDYLKPAKQPTRTPRTISYPPVFAGLLLTADSLQMAGTAALFIATHSTYFPTSQNAVPWYQAHSELASVINVDEPCAAKLFLSYRHFLREKAKIELIPADEYKTATSRLSEEELSAFQVLLKSIPTVAPDIQYTYVARPSERVVDAPPPVSYVTRWLPWYEKAAVPSNDLPPVVDPSDHPNTYRVAPLQVLIAKAGALSLLLEKYEESSTDMHQILMDQSVLSVIYHYESKYPRNLLEAVGKLHVNKPLPSSKLQSKSRKHVGQTLARIGTELAESPLAWY
jgi:hypothetical protein